MLYVIYGKNVSKGKDKVRELVETLQKKRPDADFFKISSDEVIQGKLDELIGSQGLFSAKYIVELDQVLSSKEGKAVVLDRLPDLKEAEHIFILFEESILAADLKKLEKYAAKIQELETVPKKKPTFNLFGLGDALGERDKRMLWSLYVDARHKEFEPEEIHSILMWQVKNMLIVKDQDPEETKPAKLNPFVEKKARSFAKNYSLEELRTVSSRLMTMFHESRRGKEELDRELEKFTLTI